MFDELGRKSPDSSAETVFHEIITTARVIQNALSKSEEIQGAIRKGYTEATRTHSAAIERHTHQVCIHSYVHLDESTGLQENAKNNVGAERGCIQSEDLDKAGSLELRGSKTLATLGAFMKDCQPKEIQSQDKRQPQYRRGTSHVDPYGQLAATF